MRKILLSGVALLALAACSQQASDETARDGTDKQENTNQQAAPTTPELGSFGIDLSVIQSEIAPGDDFFRYVNGKWLETFEIPADFTNYGSFTVLFERSEERVRGIIQDMATTKAAMGSTEQKIGDFYSSFVDTDRINEIGLAVAQNDLTTINSLESHEDVAKLFANISVASESPIAGWVDIDSKNTARYIFYITQSGLGMPNRDYYLEENFADKQVAYKKFLATMLGFTGAEDVQPRADAIYALEERMANAHWTSAKRRERDLTYNLYTIEELQSYAPDFPWTDMMAEMDLDGESEFVVRENDAIQALGKIFRETPVDVWKDYLTVHYLSANAAVLPGNIDDANFAFYGAELGGQPEQRKRWKRGVAAVNGALGEAVGQIYVSRYFPPESKAQMDALVDNLKKAFLVRLESNEWMSEETKAEARTKLAAFTTKIGYPEKWKDYSEFKVVNGDAFGNMKRANQWEWQDMISKLGGPIDRTEWFMTPQTVNAYYSPNRNEIVFPAAILQAPFFDPNADPAVNYGGIGAVIGHEIGHGFDDQGRKSDATGMLRDWWTADDAERFEKRADKLGAQYAQYSPLEGFFIDPKLTMGENIGDLGGLTMALEAYQLSLGGKEAPVIDGLTGEQRFFMAWAQVWKRKYREDELERRLTTDSHSPSEYRTNGIVRNMDAWYTAFDIKEDDELYLPPEERVTIW
jgi:putative endopeptidase